MYNLLHVYDCPNCGKRLSDEVEYLPVQVAEDEWDKLPFCNKCNREVTQRVSYDIKTKQEMQHFEEVDDERASWAHGFYDEEDDFGEDDLDDFYPISSEQAQRFENGEDDLPF